MNPGEQDQNPFRQPDPSAGFASNSRSTNASRYFSGRRYNAPQTQAQPQQYQMQAQQPQAQTDTTPEFFKQAMAQRSAPQYYAEPKRERSKKPLFIGLGVIAGIIIIALAVTLLPRKIGEITNTAKLADIKADIKEYAESLILLDDCINESFDFPLSGGKESDQQFKDELISSLEKTKEFRKKLDQYKYFEIKTQMEEIVSISDYTDKISKAIDERMPAYTTYSKIMTALMDAYISDGNEQKIDAFGETLNSPSKSTTISNLKKYYQNYKVAYDDKISYEQAKPAIVEMNIAEDSLLTDKSIEVTMTKALQGISLEENVRELITEIKNASEVTNEDYE